MPGNICRIALVCSKCYIRQAVKTIKLKNLDPAQRQKLAALVPTSDAMLRQYAAGTRQASSSMAIRIERAAERMGLSIPRSQLAAGCATCEYARHCEKRKRRDT